LDKIAQNLREYTILFGNIYELSRTLVKFHEDFFQHKSCVYVLFFIYVLSYVLFFIYVLSYVLLFMFTSYS